MCQVVPCPHSSAVMHNDSCTASQLRFMARLTYVQLSQTENLQSHLQPMCILTVLGVSQIGRVGVQKVNKFRNVAKQRQHRRGHHQLYFQSSTKWHLSCMPQQFHRTRLYIKLDAFVCLQYAIIPATVPVVRYSALQLTVHCKGMPHCEHDTVSWICWASNMFQVNSLHLL